MPEFTYHTRETAPEEALPYLPKGFIPNLRAIMAEAPSLVHAYHAMSELYSKTSFSPLEQQVVLMTANFENNCDYCVPWHTLIMVKGDMPREVIDALRAGTSIPDTKLEALRAFTRDMIHAHGQVSDDRVQAFLDAGYTNQHALEVILGLALKTMSNYTNSIAHTKLDDPPREFAWTKPEPAAV